MYQDRNCLILYTTAVCNLNCVYCFIDKNPALEAIDKYLDDSFMKTPDYYINYAKEMFDQQKLNSMQIWGGEPFLAMHRAYYTVEKCIEYFPNLKSFMVSTNMVSDVFSKEFWGLIDVFRKFPQRKFEFRLQLSCDGPEYINDANRGKGVTKKIVAVFEQLTKDAQEKLPDNVKLTFGFKPTLDIKSIAALQTEERVLEYFRFFEEFITTFNNINTKKNLVMNYPVPNTACPSPHTKDDGIKFANYCRLCREIEKKKILKYYRSITSFERNYNPKLVENVSLNGVCMGHCGNGKSTLGLLPDYKISCCHNGFVDMCAEYKKNIQENNSAHMSNVTIEKGLFSNQKNVLMFDKDSREFELYQRKLEEFHKQDSKVKITNVASLILLLAMHNQIDAKYQNKEEAIKGATFILSHTAYCVRDNLGTSGSIYTYPLGIIKLLLNGAREYIERKPPENGGNRNGVRR